MTIHTEPAFGALAMADVDVVGVGGVLLIEMG